MTISKKYPQKEEESGDSSVREPAATYGTDLNDPKRLEAPPCQFSIEELIQEIEQAEADIKAHRTMSAEEMKKQVLDKYLLP